MSYKDENDHIFDPHSSISMIAGKGGLTVDWKSVNDGRGFQAVLKTPDNRVEAVIDVPNISISHAPADTSECTALAAKTVKNYQARTATAPGPVVK
ncbi:MAG: hypothetical protein H6853_06210 [Rhodospirillales bacterium]|nr:hypothetical protein [Alphaproteobacteria bacterium]USO03130.1 MAG: hypothetical protein H6853_06210 [Rhodospirillales bacterium]